MWYILHNSILPLNKKGMSIFRFRWLTCMFPLCTHYIEIVYGLAENESFKRSLCPFEPAVNEKLCGSYGFSFMDHKLECEPLWKTGNCTPLVVFKFPAFMFHRFVSVLELNKHVGVIERLPVLMLPLVLNLIYLNKGYGNFTFDKRFKNH